MATGTTNYPTTLDTADELIRAANVASSTIDTGGVTSGATTINVVSAASAPASGVAWCGTEEISFTGKTATTLTGCVRGYDGTTAAAHLAGDPIYFDIITAAHHRVLVDAAIALETQVGTGSPTGTGVIVKTTSPTIVTPTIASLTNMNHDHSATGATGGLVNLQKQIPANNFIGYAYQFEEFYGSNTTSGQIGTIGWLATNGTSAWQFIAGHPGCMRRDTSSTASTVASLHLGSVVDPADTWDHTWVVRLNTADGVASTRIGFILFTQITTNPPSDGIYFEKLLTDTNWFGCIRAGSASTRVDTTVAISTNWLRLRLRRITSTQIGFSINGATEVTATATNPTGSHAVGLSIANNASSLSRTIDVDYWEGLSIVTR